MESRGWEYIKSIQLVTNRETVTLSHCDRPAQFVRYCEAQLAAAVTSCVSSPYFNRKCEISVIAFKEIKIVSVKIENNFIVQTF